MTRKHLFGVTKKDFKIEWFSGSGSGGQYRNRHPNCCRLTHIEKGIVTQGTEQSKRPQNQKKAFERMLENKDFKRWLTIKSSEAALGQDTIERRVEKLMAEKNIKLEVHDEDGRWIEVENVD